MASMAYLPDVPEALDLNSHRLCRIGPRRGMSLLVKTPVVTLPSTDGHRSAWHSFGNYRTDCSWHFSSDEDNSDE